MSVQFKATVQTASVLHTQLAVPFSPAAHRLHLPHLPAAETSKVPTQIGMELHKTYKLPLKKQDKKNNLLFNLDSQITTIMGTFSE